MPCQQAGFRAFAAMSACRLVVSAAFLAALGCASACRNETRQREPGPPGSEVPVRLAKPLPVPEPREPLPFPEPADPFHYRLELLTTGQEHRGWVRVREFFNEGDKATVQTDWEGSNRIVIQTSNVRRMQLNLDALPRDPRKSMALRFDGQGIELSPHHGPIVAFERGQAGQWSLIRE